MQYVVVKGPKDQGEKKYLSKLGIKTPLSKVPILGGVLVSMPIK